MHFLVLALFPLLVVLAGCGGSVTHETLAERGLVHLEQIVTVLEGVTDETTAKAAALQLDKLVDQLVDTKALVVKLPARTPELQQALNTKFAERSRAAGMRLEPAIMRIQGDKNIEAILKPAIEKLSKFQ